MILFNYQSYWEVMFYKYLPVKTEVSRLEYIPIHLMPNIWFSKEDCIMDGLGLTSISDCQMRLNGASFSTCMPQDVSVVKNVTSLGVYVLHILKIMDWAFDLHVPLPPFH